MNLNMLIGITLLIVGFIWLHFVFTTEQRLAIESFVLGTAFIISKEKYF